MATPYRLSPEDRDELIRLRRDFHRHPELGFQETYTSGVVGDFLENLDLEVRRGVGKTGVVGLMKGPAGGPVIALRADMDALPIQEVEGREYASLTPGLMHACGHDGHTATLLATMKALRGGEALSGTVKAIFQPAEEGDGGAKAMIGDGVLENPRPDLIVALHYWSGLPTGKVGILAGPVMASADDFRLTVRGKGGHAAAPHETVDPIYCAAEIVTNLQAIVSREIAPLKPAVVSVCEFHAGTAFNIIPEEARLTGTVRTMDPKVWKEMPERLERIVAGICAAHGCEYEMDYRRVYGVTANDPKVTETVREVAGELLGEDALVGEVSMGSEDMSDFFAEIPGCFIFVGSGSEEKGTTAPHHHPAFDLDEDALEIGVKLMVGVVKKVVSHEF